MMPVSDCAIDSIAAAGLPVEIILAILKLATRRWLGVHPRWTASLQLVCHATQVELAPIIYNVFVVQYGIEYGYDRDGIRHEFWSLEARRLVEILGNDAPRIRHLVLGQHALDRLFCSIKVPTCVRQVERISIIAHQWHYRLPTPTRLTISSKQIDVLYTGAVRGSILYMRHALSWTRRRFWAAETWDNFVPHYNYLVTNASDASRQKSDTRSSEWFFVEFGGLMTLSRPVLSDIANILLRPPVYNPDVHREVVLVCPPGYTTPWGLEIDKTVQLLDKSRVLPRDDRASEERWCIREGLPVVLDHLDFRMLRRSQVDPEVLYSRIHVSHALWGCNEAGWEGWWYGHAVERGDVWDEGRLVRRFGTPAPM